ncbi:hypothetical protein F8M41_021343 [Gigaspora margarita]|uniref:Uncharacterized protein n=1 Tax=Gigaspora margarita TaxID=4874 RepID=A0A8H4B1H3_GIGMA|nr:hypothetical protein F8M41_021343 [Gigaspora margarita]
MLKRHKTQTKPQTLTTPTVTPITIPKTYSEIISRKKSINWYEEKKLQQLKEKNLYTKKITATNEIYKGTNDADSNDTNNDFNHNSNDDPTGIPETYNEEKKSISSMKGKNSYARKT